MDDVDGDMRCWRRLRFSKFIMILSMALEGNGVDGLVHRHASC